MRDRVDGVLMSFLRGRGIYTSVTKCRDSTTVFFVAEFRFWFVLLSRARLRKGAWAFAFLRFCMSGGAGWNGRRSCGFLRDPEDYMLMFVLVEEATKQFENTLCFHSAYTARPANADLREEEEI